MRKLRYVLTVLAVYPVTAMKDFAFLYGMIGIWFFCTTTLVQFNTYIQQYESAQWDYVEAD